MVRCLNIDWLECYCLERSDIEMNADFFEADGWHVIRRAYGTRVYDEMFTLCEYHTDEPMIEIRRAPVGAKFANSKQVLDPDSCHIRLTNRSCYYQQAAKLMQDFLTRYQYIFCRISRIDLCLDFEKFDSGDDPQKFVTRYLSNRYSKMYQSSVRAVGKDFWDGRFWNSLSWGSKTSQITTKLYNKTLELKECKDKPYIRQAWALAGLVDDFIRLTKTNDQGIEYKPTIWRLEFSISSAAHGWFVLDHDVNGKTKYPNGKPYKYSVRNDLDIYMTKQGMLNIFASLVAHYFRFKHVKEKPLKGIALMAIRTKVDWVDREKLLERKDRCPDKELFNFTREQNEFYQIERVATATPPNRMYNALLKALEDYKLTHTETAIQNACQTLIDDIRGYILRRNASDPTDPTEIALLQQLIAIRIKSDNKQNVTAEQVKAILTIFDEVAPQIGIEAVR